MKILLATHGFPPEHTGGTEHATSALARDLALLGHEVIVVAGSDQPADACFRRDAADSHRVFEVVRCHRSDPHYGHWHKRHSPEISRGFMELLQQERPDVVHVHHWLRLTDDLVRIAARQLIAVVTTLHDYGSSCPIMHRVPAELLGFCRETPCVHPCSACATRHYLHTPWVDQAAADDYYQRWLAGSRAELAASSVLVCLSRDHADGIATAFGLGQRPSIVPPALAQAPMRRAVRPVGQELVLGAWGSLHQLKGADILIAAVRLARADGVGIVLHLAGQSVDPPFEARIRELIVGLPVHLHGRYERLQDHPVSDVDAFVSGTRAHETWGLVADEAIALGKPLILPAAGAFPERFGDSARALLYEPGNARSLADVLVRLCRDESLRRRFFAPIADTVMNTPIKMARRYEQFYGLARERGAPVIGHANPAEAARAAAWHDAWNRNFVGHYGQNGP